MSDPIFRADSLKSIGTDVCLSHCIDIKRPSEFSIGNHSAIDFGFFCSVSADIGDHVHIGPHVSVIGGSAGHLRMGHFTNFAAGCRVICGTDRFLGAGLIGAAIPDAYRDEQVVRPVILKCFANVGSNVVLMPGVTIGEGAVVGANSLVTTSIEPWTINFGSPARVVRDRPKDKILEYAKKLGY